MGFRPALLTGSLTGPRRRDIHEAVGKGVYNLIIGTQSLIREEVSFQNLGLVIIDEQHRFGVRERALMDRKGGNPNLLVMTATPIPRTLAMTLYADMDISFIRAYPEGRKGVVTRVLSRSDKRWVFEEIRKRMSLGQQVFVICPVIEGSEEEDMKNAVDMAGRLHRSYPEYRIGLVHGRMPPPQRERVMEEFRRGLIDLLVGTTVVEVGVHVPGATVMVIEHPDRFGLAQLHQLRGRVGRGTQGGLCLLILSGDVSERAESRLRTLVECEDGFEIARRDLQERGHGELMGMRQAGLGELDPIEIMKNQDLLKGAREKALTLLESDPELVKPENRPLNAFVQSLLSKPLDI